MSKQQWDEESVARLRNQMQSFWTRGKPSTVTVSADDLVSVTLDARFHVESVKVHQPVAREDRDRLERAIASAVNDAIREIMTQNAQHFAKLMARSET